MDRLRRLGLRENWIYEVLISTYRHRTPHAAPTGVWTGDADRLLMDLYNGSRTLAAILETGHFVANFPADVEMLYAALHATQRLTFAEARVQAPVVVGCTATVELTLSEATPRGDTVRVVGAVERVDHAQAPRLINRAEGLLLESLVLVTRLDHTDPARTLAALTENCRVARKVAPGSVYELALAALVRDLVPPSS